MSSVGLQPDKQVQSRPAGPSRLSGQRPYVLGLLLILLTVALYYPVHTHPYTNYDDNVYVTDNVHVQEGLTNDTLRWAFVTDQAGNWHPLTWLSHALDLQLFGDQAPGRQHLTSLLLHALNAALLCWVLFRATGYAGRSFMVAALFAVHPINVESVAWIAERKTVLSMLFFLLALGAYRWYAEKPKALRYASVAILFACGLMSKPQVITFPFVLLLWDYWPLRRMALPGAQNLPADSSAPALPQRGFLALVAEKLPLFLLAAASAAITMKVQRGSGAVISFDTAPLSIRLSNGIVCYVRYLSKTFWPRGLAPMYPHPGDSLPAWQVYGALLILLTVTMLVVARRSNRYLFVGWFWYLGTLVPMIGLVQVGRQAMADRYAYLPLIGIFIMMCWGLADWASAVKAAPEPRFPGSVQTRLAAWLPEASIVMVLALGFLAHRQITLWASNETLWRHTIQVTPPNYVAEDNLGWVLGKTNRMDEAIVHFRRAAAIHPVDPISTFNIGFYDQQHGDFAAAITEYKRALILTTSTTLKRQTLENMAYAYHDSGRPAEARECLTQASQLEGP